MRTRTPWMLTALIIAVALVVRSAVEQGPRAVRAEPSMTTAFETAPRLRSASPKARVGTPRRSIGITRDFFVLERPVASEGQGVAATPPSMGARPTTDAEIEAAISDLVLQAIVMDERPRALLNDQFVRVGESLILEGHRNVVYEVKAIYEESVVLVGGKTSVVLRLAPPINR